MGTDWPSVESCIRLFVVLVRVSAAAPMTTSASAKNEWHGAMAVCVQSSPKTASPISSNGN